MGVESFGIPVPGETALIAFGVLASQGHYPIAVVIGVAAAGAIVGDNLGFWLIGRRGGRALLGRAGWLENRAKHALPRAEALVDRYGGRAVFFGRFVSVVRETIAWVAGLAGCRGRGSCFGTRSAGSSGLPQSDYSPTSAARPWPTRSAGTVSTQARPSWGR